MTVYIRRGGANTYDKYVVAVVVGIKGVGYAHIGYVVKGLAQSLAGIIEKGIPIKSEITITGGYGWKETFGALVNITV